MKRIARLGDSIIIAQPEGDRPAVITRADSAELVEVCAFMPMPTHLQVVRIHGSRPEAIGAALRDTCYHGYWNV